MKLSILVVLYDCCIEESRTLQSLVKLLHGKSDCRVVVWNNGPRSLKLEEFDGMFSVGVEFSVFETVDNRSLSKIYNYFIKRCPAEKFLFLDHDTSLNQSYIDSVYSMPDSFLGVPIVVSNQSIEYPMLDWVKVGGGDEIGSDDLVMSCLSGLVLGRGFVDCLLAQYDEVFDEVFVLYGVDTSFFLRVHKLRLNHAIRFVGSIEHSFSRNENEAKSINQFRVLERSYDLGLTLRYYPNSHHFKIFYYVMRAFVRGAAVLSPAVVLKAFVSGRHYRSSCDDTLLPDELAIKRLGGRSSC